MALRFDDSGPSGTPAVCLPWFGTSRVTTRDALEPALAPTAVRRIWLDLPGHGDSPALPQATSEAVLEALMAFVEGEVQEPVLLVGCSYGGYLAAALARRRPDLVTGLLLVCPGVRRERDLAAATQLDADEDWLDAAPAGLRGHLERALGNRTRPVVERVVAALEAGGPGDEEYLDALQGGDGYFLDDEDAGGEFTGPVAVVTGRQDRIVGFADQYRRMSSFPRGTFVVADAAGHYLPYERPDVLHSVTRDWLQRCDVR